MGKERDVNGQCLSLWHESAKISISDESFYSDQVGEEWNLLDLRKELFFTDWSVQARQIKLIGISLEDGLVANLLRSSTTFDSLKLILQSSSIVIVIEDKAESFALNSAE